eukprot:1453761-Prymnesium_polylepis.1
MILARRTQSRGEAQRLDTHMRAHNRGLSVTRPRSKRHDSGLQSAFEENTDFFLLTDLPWGWAILHGT